MKDLELKKSIVIDSLDKIKRRFNHFNYHFLLTGEKLKRYDFYESVVNHLTDDENRVIHNLNNSRYKTIKKCKDFIKDKIFSVGETFDLDILFLTLTFNDETLNNTSELARRKRIRLFLKNNCVSFIANIDFGLKNEREHYHAIAVMKYKYNLEKYEKNGFFKAVKVNISDKDSECIAKYINKLTYHAYKDTTTHENISYRCIYYTTLKY